MKYHRHKHALAVVLVGLWLLVAGTACIERLLAINAASFGAGWLLGRLTTPTTVETQCFRNGQPIDCQDLLPQR